MNNSDINGGVDELKGVQKQTLGTLPGGIPQDPPGSAGLVSSGSGRESRFILVSIRQKLREKLAAIWIPVRPFEESVTQGRFKVGQS